MLKITSFSALIVGLLLSLPMVFSTAEAGRSGLDGMILKSDRDTSKTPNSTRIALAFGIVDDCARQVGAATSPDCSRHDSVSANAHSPEATTTIELRDEAKQTSILTSVPSASQ